MAPKFHVIAVGRLGGGPEAALCADYVARLARQVEILEIDDRRAPNGAARKDWEAREIARRLPDARYLCLLDERGSSLSSLEFAKLLGDKIDQGAGIAFVIGGPDGFSDDLRKRADLLLAFGRATWPHKLVRGMLLEQIYRATTILTGHPYHRA